MPSTDRLLHPDLLASIPFGETLTGRLLERRVTEALADDPNADPNVTVVVRTLNEAATLELLLLDVRRQAFAAEVEIIVVDNESTDGTPDVAKQFGARVVSFPDTNSPIRGR